MSALPPDERSRDAADPVATFLADPVAERFIAGDDRLAALLRDLPPFTAPETLAVAVATAARAVQARMAAESEQRAGQPMAPAPAFVAPTTLSAGVLQEAARLQAAQTARRAVVFDQVAQGKPAADVLGAPVSDATEAWLRAQAAQHREASAREAPVSRPGGPMAPARLSRWWKSLGVAASAFAVAGLATKLVLSQLDDGTPMTASLSSNVMLAEPERAAAPPAPALASPTAPATAPGQAAAPQAAPRAPTGQAAAKTTPAHREASPSPSARKESAAMPPSPTPSPPPSSSPPDSAAEAATAMAAPAAPAAPATPAAPVAPVAPAAPAALAAPAPMASMHAQADTAPPPTAAPAAPAAAPAAAGVPAEARARRAPKAAYLAAPAPAPAPPEAFGASTSAGSVTEKAAAEKSGTVTLADDPASVAMQWRPGKSLHVWSAEPDNAAVRDWVARLWAAMPADTRPAAPYGIQRDDALARDQLRIQQPVEATGSR